MSTIDYEALLDDMRNALHGFGVYLASQRDDAIDLYCELDEGGRMLVTWHPAHGGHYEIRMPNHDDLGVTVVRGGSGPFSPNEMLTHALPFGFAVNMDEVVPDSNDPEITATRLDMYMAVTRTSLRVGDDAADRKLLGIPGTD